MIFSSPQYVFLFLPIMVIGYYILNRMRLILGAKVWLVLGSLFFYGYWNPSYLFLIISSILVNYAIGTTLLGTAPAKRGDEEQKAGKLSRRTLLIVGVWFNLALLGYFKYADFFIENVNEVLGTQFPALHIVLPLAISFFTFQQIAYIADCHKGRRGKVKYNDFLNYCLFVTFFPQLIAGPIVHHAEMMPQFANKRNAILQWNNMSAGLFIFCIGLFKKIYIADEIGVWVAAGFDTSQVLSFLDAWLSTISFSLQLYFDFSAYSDMAIGAGLMFNVRLPNNFNSPLKARSPRDFWDRWHMTLTRWLRDYLFKWLKDSLTIPFNTNRRAPGRLYFNLFMTFLLAGLWHGAAWNFVAFGAVMGAGLVIHRWWQNHGYKMHDKLAWVLCYIFLCFNFMLFRTPSMERAGDMAASMIGLNGFSFSETFANRLPEFISSAVAVVPNSEVVFTQQMVNFVLVSLLVAFFAKNSIELMEGKKTYGIFAYVTCLVALIVTWNSAVMQTPSEFLYFNF